MKLKRGLFWSSASLILAIPADPVPATLLEASAQTPEPFAALLSVGINGSKPGEPVALLRDGDKIYAPSSALAEWRLTPGAPAFHRDDTAYHLLNGIAGIRLDLDEESQILKITVPPEMLGQTRLSYARVELDDRVVGGRGAFLNYDVSTQLASGASAIGGTVEAGIFVGNGIGIASAVARSSAAGTEVVRLDSHWTFDDPDKMRSVRVGDSISRGGVGGLPVRFTGFQVARNFGVQPGFITMPLPSLRGSAAVPSVIDIYVNDLLRGTREIPAGPFEIANVPVVTGNGEVNLVVRDLLGRETVYNHSYYSASRLLAKGLSDYSYEAGFLRHSYGRRSNDYGALMVSGTHRYGISDTLTGELHAEATKDAQGIAAGGTIALPGIASVDASVGASHSQRGAGALVAVGVERRSRGLSFGIRGEVTSDRYTGVGWTAVRRPPSSTVHAFAGLPAGPGGLGLSYIRRKGRTEPTTEQASASYSLRLARIGSIHFAARRNFTQRKGLAAEISFMRPLGGRASMRASGAVADGASRFGAVVQRNLPAGEGFGYQFGGSTGTLDRLDGRLSLQTGFGTHDAQVSWVDGNTGLRLSTSGGIGLLEGDAFVSRQLDQSFARVEVGDYEGVRVYADNQLIGKTNADGVVLLPKLRAYDRNVVRIDLADLPMDAEVEEDRATVRPYSRHGVKIRFDAKASRGGILRILLEDGSPLPAGAIVRIDGAANEFVVAPGGDVYFTGLSEVNEAVASWSMGLCRFQLLFQSTDRPQPRLPDAVCRSAVQ